MEFFGSYLSERKQIVQVESKQSEVKEVGDTGVPQGSFIGGLCFIIYECDFPEQSDECESVLFVDDDMDNVTDADPDILENKLQIQANKSTEWVRDNNMVCAGEKTKLLVISTKELRQNKLTPNNKEIKVNVCGESIEETTDEKLLGIVISNDLTWKTYLYGNNKTGSDKIIGLLSKLSQRVGILSRLRRVMNNNQFRKVSEGLFSSKLNYCCQLWGNVTGISPLDDTDRRYTAFSREDNRKLQVIQNKVFRLQTNLQRETPLTELLRCTGAMSVHQLIAYHTIMTVHRVIISHLKS